MITISYCVCGQTKTDFNNHPSQLLRALPASPWLQGGKRGQGLNQGPRLPRLQPHSPGSVLTRHVWGALSLDQDGTRMVMVPRNSVSGVRPMNSYSLCLPPRCWNWEGPSVTPLIHPPSRGARVAYTLTPPPGPLHSVHGHQQFPNRKGHSVCQALPVPLPPAFSPNLVSHHAHVLSLRRVSGA